MISIRSASLNLVELTGEVLGLPMLFVSALR
jgi:hypothetical protein